MAEILIIDDEPSVSWAYAKAIKAMGHRSATAGSAEDAFAQLAERSFDLALLDLQLPGMNGLDALSRISGQFAKMPVIMLTAYTTPETTVEATRRGALDYLLKPVDLEDLQRAVRHGLEAAAGRSEGSAPAAVVEHSPPLVGRCPAMQEVYKRIGLAAACDLAVLIEGDTGTGKELVSQSIHRHSRRSGGPFVVVNCACLPAELLESELFGHVKGAFTGAVADKPGQVELAQGGTLFLDELGELPPATQASLLRFCESRRAARVGDKTHYTVDVRLVAATNRRLRSEVEAGRFRRDLYYRLNALPIALPALKDRGDDLTLLMDHFLQRSHRPDGAAPVLTAETRRRLAEHSWPGNIRELRNTLEHASLMSRGGPIRPEHLPETLCGAADDAAGDLLTRLARLADTLLEQRLAGDEAGARYEALMSEFERPLLEAGMRRFGGHQANLAATIRMHRTTLRERLRKYGLIAGGADDGNTP